MTDFVVTLHDCIQKLNRTDQMHQLYRFLFTKCLAVLDKVLEDDLSLIYSLACVNLHTIVLLRNNRDVAGNPEPAGCGEFGESEENSDDCV